MLFVYFLKLISFTFLHCLVTRRNKKKTQNFHLSLFYTEDRIAFTNGGWKQTENSWLKYTTAGSTLAWFVLHIFNLFLWTVSCFIRILSMVCIEVYELHVCINTQHLQHFIRIMFVVGLIDLYICTYNCIHIYTRERM